jgi:hypothetical protein
MSLLSLPLGYGRSAIVESDVFTRMLNDQIYDNEELRMDKPSDYTSGYEYLGLALAGSSITNAVWCCIKRTWQNNRCIRVQYKAAIPWTDRAIISW